MPSAEDVKNQLKAQTAAIVARDEAAGGSAAVQDRQPQTIREMLEDPTIRGELAKALPTMVTPERFARLCLTAINSNKTLMDCSPRSLLAASMQCAQLGLEPNTHLGHAFLIPRWSSKLQCHEVTLQIGYKGIVELALRGGKVRSIEAREVRANDLFDYEFGLQERLTHKPALRDRGDIITYYGIARFLNGHYWTLVSPERIEEHRQMSSSPDSPAWTQHHLAMSKKCVAKEMAPWLPLSSQAATALAVDDTAPDYDSVLNSPLPDEAIETQAIDAVSPESMKGVVCETCGDSDGEHATDCPERNM